jgi:hypothetical protein
MSLNLLSLLSSSTVILNGLSKCGLADVIAQVGCRIWRILLEKLRFGVIFFWLIFVF